MSPEQAEGKPVDARSDIFSFGALLYEMVTGGRAFDRDSFASTLAAVIKDQPKPPAQLVPGLPHDLEEFILRCLEKDPGRRWQGMTELSEALRQIHHAAPAVPSHTPPRLSWLAALLALPIAVLAAWLILRNTGHAGPPPKVVQLTAYQGSAIQPSFSPDGSQVEFSWNREQGGNFDIYMKLVGENHALRLTTDPASDQWPVWSPDGKRIAFLRSAANRPASIYVVSPLGGAEQKIADFPVRGHLAWSPDGKWLAVGLNYLGAIRGNGDPTGVFVVPVDGGEPRRVTNPNLPGYDTDPAFSLDGRSLAYEGCARTYSCDVYLQDLNPDYSPRGLPRRVTRQHFSISGIAWAGNSLIYGASPSWATLFHLGRVGLHGGNPPERLDLAGLFASPTVAPTANRLAFQREPHNWDIWRYQPGSPAAPLIASSLDDGSPQFSPDGSKSHLRPLAPAI